jgi:hypothetical protein
VAVGLRHGDDEEELLKTGKEGSKSGDRREKKMRIKVKWGVERCENNSGSL